MSKKKLPWFPGAVGDDPNDIYPHIGFLFFTYVWFTCAFLSAEVSRSPWVRYFAFGVLALYFTHIWLEVWFYVREDSDLTLVEKVQVLALQTSIALVLTSPLIFFFYNKWPLFNST